MQTRALPWALRWAILSAFVLLLSVSVVAAALTFPALTGRVVDDAGILDAATRAELTRASAALEAKTGDQLVIVTLKSLQGTAIEDYGYQLGRAWQIGQKGKNNGILLIVAPNERAVRIEVGYGLEGTVTDAISSLIIQSAILPRFRAGDYPGGVKAGAANLVQVLSGDAAEWQQEAQQRIDASKPTGSFPVSALILGAVCILIFCALTQGALCQMLFQALYLMMLSGGGGGSRSGGGWSSGGGGFGGGGGTFGGGGASGHW